MNPSATTASARARRAPPARHTGRGRGRGRGRGIHPVDAPPEEPVGVHAEGLPQAEDPPQAQDPPQDPPQAQDPPQDPPQAQGDVVDDAEVPLDQDDPPLASYPGGPHDMSLLRSYHRHEIRYVWTRQVQYFLICSIYDIVPFDCLANKL